MTSKAHYLMAPGSDKYQMMSPVTANSTDHPHELGTAIPPEWLAMNPPPSRLIIDLTASEPQPINRK